MKNKFLSVILCTMLVATCVPALASISYPAENASSTKSFQGETIQLKTDSFSASYWVDQRGQKVTSSHLPTQRQKTSNSDDSEQWDTLGPFAADINDMIVHGSTMYVATSSGTSLNLGGIYKSIDAGSTWTFLEETKEFGKVYDLVQRSDNPLVLFASSVNGLFRTIDGGETWTEIRPVPGSWGLSNAVTISPHDNTVMFVHYESDQYSSQRLFKSTDGGTTFTPLITGVPALLEGVTDILVDPSNPNCVYLSHGNELGESGFIASQDGGQHWVSYDEGLDDVPVNDIEVVGSTIYTVTGSDFCLQYGGVYKREGLGNPWVELAPEVFKEKSVLCIAINPENENTLMVGTQKYGVFVSDDAGAMWTTSNNGLPTGCTVKSLFYGSDTLIQIGLEGTGVFISTDSGCSWESSSYGINMVSVTDVSVDPQDQLKIFVSFISLNSGGVFITDDGGLSWRIANLPGQRVQSVTINPNDSSTIYAALDGPITLSIKEGIYKSTDGGQTWENTGPSGPNPYLNNAFDKVSCSPETSDVVAGGQGWVTGIPARIFLSHDGGATWAIVYEGPSLGEVMDFSFQQETPATIYAAEYLGGSGNSGGVLKSVNGGASWVHMNQGLPTGPKTCLSVSVCSGGIVFTALYYNGIYRSMNGGLNWEPASCFPDGYGNCVLANPFDGDDIFASIRGDVPVSRSRDGGESSEGFSEGYPESSVYRFGFNHNPDEPILYACGSQGLYFRTLNASATSVNITVNIWSSMAQVHRNSQFIFSVRITNNEETAQTVHIWTAAERLLTGSMYEPLKGPFSFSFDPSETIVYDGISQWVGNVPLGYYRYYVRVGETYPGMVESESSWDFEVIA